MQCPACKKENANNNKYCNHCGYDLGKADTAALGASNLSAQRANVSSTNDDTLPLARPGVGNPPPDQARVPYGSQPGNHASSPAGSNYGSNRQPGKNSLIICITCICLVLIGGAFYAYKYLYQGKEFKGTWYRIGSTSEVVISRNFHGFNFHDAQGDHKASYRDGQLQVEFKEGIVPASIDRDGSMVMARYGMSDIYTRTPMFVDPPLGGLVAEDEGQGDTKDKNGGNTENDDIDSDTISGQTIPPHLQSMDSNGSSKVFCRWDRATASSTLAPQGSSSYEPDNVLDSDNTTAWVEGSADTGLNEWIELESDTTQKVSSIQISNGYDKSNAVFYANNRVQRVRLDFSDGTYIYSTLLDGYGAVSQIDIGHAIKTKSLRITIMGVYQGTKYNDTCISEIRSY